MTLWVKLWILLETPWQRGCQLRAERVCLEAATKKKEKNKNKKKTGKRKRKSGGKSSRRKVLTIIIEMLVNSFCGFMLLSYLYLL